MIVIDYFVLKSVPKNTLIDYIKNLIAYIIFETFPSVGENTLIDCNDNIIDYFFEIIHFIGYLIDYNQS